LSSTSWFGLRETSLFPNTSGVNRILTPERTNKQNTSK
jgi:hypothetical protein